MEETKSKLKQVLDKLRKRGIRLEGIPEIKGKYLFEDQRGDIYFIRNSSLVDHKPQNHRRTYRVWVIKIGDVKYDYFVCGLWKNGKLAYVTRAAKEDVNFRASIIMENRVRARKGWQILYRNQ